MGAPATRITATDFVTPPELKQFHLAANGAGRIGGARIELVSGPSGTRLGDCYQQVPLHVLPAFEYGRDQPALLYLLNPTAGLFDGDAQLIRITAGLGTRAVLAGQSATRIHPCLNGFSTQQWDITVASGAVLVVLPGPAIPFQSSCYYQRVSIDLEDHASLIWGDIWLAGRYERGAASELFQFKMLIQDLTVRRSGQLAYHDRFCWRGPWDHDTAEWHFGGQPACGGLFITGSPNLEPPDGLENTTHFPTAAGDVCLRCTGSSEAVTSTVVHFALQAAGRCCHSAEPWFLGGDHLAPSHWFTFRPSKQ